MKMIIGGHGPPAKSGGERDSNPPWALGESWWTPIQLAEEWPEAVQLLSGRTLAREMH